MGLFWPPQDTLHIARLVGLLGAVAGACALLDRNTRYRALLAIYHQLRKMDPTTAHLIEQQEEDHDADENHNINAKDTRSYASDSTAFTRPNSSQRFSTMDTPEAMAQLGRALDKLKPHLAASDKANEAILPIPTPPPITAARLTPLPNPNAPKVTSAMRDGKPQLFDYTPPPSVMARRPTRAHLEIETTDHDSYGYVSNPAVLNSATTTTITTEDSLQNKDGGEHYLFVCVKCRRQNNNNSNNSNSEVCEKICGSDEDGVLRCKLKPSRLESIMDMDMEDLVMPMTPRSYLDGSRKTTGRMLYENLSALHSQHERMKARAACHGGNHSGSDHDNPLECPNAVKSRLRIVPVNCLSMCHLGNVVALSAPGKFGYQFGAMNESDSEDMQAILQFAEDYIESPDGFTKNKTRPARLSRNILARIPPPLPKFTSLAE